jgi:hypothetical protein
VFVSSDASISTPTIDNFSYAYYLHVDFNHDVGSGGSLSMVRFYGCHIEYELAAPSSN